MIEGKATKENPKKYVFENLKNMGEYYFIYDTTGENKKKEGDIVFEIYNNKSKNPDGTPRVGKTTVKMESQNLFLLDRQRRIKVHIFHLYNKTNGISGRNCH